MTPLPPPAKGPRGARHCSDPAAQSIELAVGQESHASPPAALRDSGVTQTPSRPPEELRAGQLCPLVCPCSSLYREGAALHREAAHTLRAWSRGLLPGAPNPHKSPSPGRPWSRTPTSDLPSQPPPVSAAVPAGPGEHRSSPPCTELPAERPLCVSACKGSACFTECAPGLHRGTPPGGGRASPLPPCITHGLGGLEKGVGPRWWVAEPPFWPSYQSQEDTLSVACCPPSHCLGLWASVVPVCRRVLGRCPGQPPHPCSHVVSLAPDRAKTLPCTTRGPLVLRSRRLTSQGHRSPGDKELGAQGQHQARTLAGR